MFKINIFFKKTVSILKSPLLISEWLVIIATILLPYQARFLWARFNGGQPWAYGSFSIFVLEIIIWLAFILFIFGGNAAGGEPRQGRGLKKFWSDIKKGVKSILIFLPIILWAVVSLFWTKDITASVTWFSYALTAVIYGFLFWRLSKEQKFWSLATALFIGSASIIITWFTQFVPASTWLGTGEHHPAFLGQSVVQFGEWGGANIGERWLRAYGLFPHPNLAAGFVVALLSSLWLLAHKINRATVVSVAVFLSAVAGAAILATMSKSGAIALIVIIIFWLIFFRDSFWKLPVAAIFGLAVFAVVTWPQVDARIQGQQTFEQFSRYERILGYKEAWQQKTWFGSGLGASTLTPEKKVVLAPQPVHDIPLLILTELGLIGLALAVGTFFAVVYFSRAYKNRQWWFLFLTLVPLLAFDHYLISLFAGLMLIPVIIGNLRDQADKINWD